jgi:hypothetical protein
MTVITVLLIGLLLFMPVVILYWSSYNGIYTGISFSVLISLLAIFFYDSYGDRENRDHLKNLIGSLFGRGKSEEVVFKVRVVPLMHLIILFVVSPFALFIFYAMFRIEFNWVLVIVNFIFWGSMFFVPLFSVFFSRLYVYKWGIRYRLNLTSFDDISRVRLKWGKRLLIINKIGVHWVVEQHWYLLPNSSDFLKKLKSLKSELQTEYE